MHSSLNDDRSVCCCAYAAAASSCRVGSNADGWSNEFSFIPPSQTTEELTFLMFNDVGMKLIGVNVDMCGASDSSNCPKSKFS